MGYNHRNDEIHDNIARVRAQWVAERDALATVRRFNAKISAKSAVCVRHMQLVHKYLISGDDNFHRNQYDDYLLSRTERSVSIMSANAFAVSVITVSFRVNRSARSFNSYSSSSLA